MSKRMQVLFEEQEYAEIQAIAQRNRMTVAEWVRQALRAARRHEASNDEHAKLRALREAMAYEFPAGLVLVETANLYGRPTVGKP